MPRSGGASAAHTHFVPASLVTVTKALIIRYNVRQIASNVDTIRYKVRKLATNVDTLRYKVRVLATNADILRYKIRKLTGLRTYILKYKIRRLTGTKTYILRYPIRIKSGQSSDTLRYKVRVKTGLKTNTFRYKTIQFATKVNTIRYKIRKLASNSDTIQYKIRKVTGLKANTFRYKIRVKIGNTDTIRWKMRQVATNVETFRYKTIQFATNVDTIRYKIRIKASSSDTLRYKVRKVTGLKTNTLKYKIRKLTGTKSNTLLYKIRRLTGVKTNTLRYKIRQLATNTDIIRYNLGGVARRVSIIRYKVRTRISVPLIQRYKIRKKTGQVTRILRYKIRVKTGLKTNTIKYKIRLLVSKPITLQYKVRQVGSKTYRFVYNLVDPLSIPRRALTFNYKIRKLVRVQPQTPGIAIQCDAVDDYISCGTDAALWSQSLTKFSFSVWIFMRSPMIVNLRPIDRHISSTGGFGIYIPNTTTANFRIRLAGPTDYFGTASGLSNLTDRWVHFVCTFDSTLGSNNLKIYVDSVVGATQNTLTSAVPSVSHILSISAHELSNAGINGFARDFRWWTTKPLTQAEVNAVFTNSGSAPSPDYWLPLNEGTGTPKDSITGTKTASLLNGASWSSLIPTTAQTALQFDGVNDYINCGDDSALWSQTLTKFSFSCWIYPTKLAGGTSMDIFRHGSSGNGIFVAFLDGTAGNRARLSITNDVGTVATANVDTIVANTWNFITCVYDGSLPSANVKIYNNGATTTTNNAVGSVTKTATIATLAGSTTDLQGCIKDFRWWTTKALTPTEIALVMGDSVDAPAPDYRLRLNEGIGIVVTDVISNTKTATLTNGPVWSPLGLTQRYNIKRRQASGAAVQFAPAAVTAMVNAGSPTVLSNFDSFTISVWVNPTNYGPSSTPHIITKGYPANNMFMIYFTAVTGIVTFRIQGSDASLKSAVSISSPQFNKWTHILCRYDISTGLMTLKLNNIVDGTATQTVVTPSSIGGTTPLTMNAAASSIKWSGKAKDLRVFRSALSDAECTKVFQNDPTAIAPDYWLPMNEGYGLDIKDKIQPLNIASLSPLGVTWVYDGTASRYGIKYLTGKIEGIGFDGLNDYVDLPSDIALWGAYLKAFSLSVWVCPKMYGPNPENREIISHGWANTGSFLIYIDVQGRFAARIVKMDNTLSTIATNTGIVVNLGSWYHITLTYDNSLASQNLKLYIDGKPAPLFANLTDVLLNPQTLRLGGILNEFGGVLKDFRFWVDKILTQDEIDSIRSQPNIANGPTPHCWMKLNEGVGSPVDTINGNRVGTMTNGAYWAIEPSGFKYNVRQLVSVPETLRYKIRKLMSKPITLRYKLRQLATNTDTLRYKVRQVARNTDTLIYKIRKVSGLKTNIIRYKIRKLTGVKTNIHRYKMRQVATNVDTISYKVRVLTGIKVSSVRYKIRKLTGQKVNIVRYKIRKKVGPVVSRVKYNIARLTGFKSSIQRYRIHRLTGPKSITMRYKVRKLVSVMSRLKYKIIFSQVVSMQTAFFYNIRQRVTNTDSHRYKRRALTGLAAMDFLYDIRVKTGARMYKFQYNITSLAARVSIARYKIRILTGQKTNTLRYKMRQVATATNTIQYNIFQLVTTEIIYAYKIAGAIYVATRVLTSRYKVKVVASRLNTFVYRIAGYSPSNILHPDKHELNLPEPVSSKDIVGEKANRISIGSIIDTGLYYITSLGEKVRIRKVKR